MKNLETKFHLGQLGQGDYEYKRKYIRQQIERAKIALARLSRPQAESANSQGIMPSGSSQMEAKVENKLADNSHLPPWNTKSKKKSKKRKHTSTAKKKSKQKKRKSRSVYTVQGGLPSLGKYR